MTHTPTTAPRWVSCASASAATWAMRSLPRWRPAGPGWPPDSAPDTLIVSLLAFVAGGAFAGWMLRRGDGGPGRLRWTRTPTVLTLGVLTQLGLVVVWTTVGSPSGRLTLLVALAAFTLGLLVTATRPSRLRGRRTGRLTRCGRMGAWPSTSPATPPPTRSSPTTRSPCWSG